MLIRKSNFSETAMKAPELTVTKNDPD